MDNWPVGFAPQARVDLREIASFIKRNNPDRARTFGNALIEKAMSLGAHPRMGRAVPELNDPAVREIVHGAYRIIYELREVPAMVLVLRFWHGARGVPVIAEE